MNEEAVCSQGSLTSCCRCCLRRACLTLNPAAWLGTNICMEQLSTAWGHLGTWHSWALPTGHLGTQHCLGDTWAPGTSGHCPSDTSKLLGLGNIGCCRAKGSDGDSVAVPAVVRGPLGHVGPSPAGAVCLGSRLGQPWISPAAPLPHAAMLPAAVSGDDEAVSPGATTLAAPMLGRNCKAAVV